MKEGERILFSVGLELALGLTSWDEIVQKMEDFNNKYFNNMEDTNECCHCNNK